MSAAYETEWQPDERTLPDPREQPGYARPGVVAIVSNESMLVVPMLDALTEDGHVVQLVASDQEDLLERMHEFDQTHALRDRNTLDIVVQMGATCFGDMLEPPEVPHPIQPIYSVWGEMPASQEKALLKLGWRAVHTQLDIDALAKETTQSLGQIVGDVRLMGRRV